MAWAEHCTWRRPIVKSLSILVTICCATAVFAAQPHTNAVVIPVSAAPQLLIPAAGSTPGANGTYFRSDITIMNFASHDQLVKLQWLPQGSGTQTSTTITIPAQSGIRSGDFVASYLNQTGLGSIIVSGMADANSVDPNAVLYVSSRIWTMQPGTNGTTSQSLPAVPTNALFATSIAGLFAVGGADNVSNYRVNVGIVNVDPANSQTFQITVPGANGTNIYSMTLPPMTMQQVSLGSGLPATQQVLIQNTTPSATQSNLWVAYGSTVDNTTGDAWSELAVPGQ